MEQFTPVTPVERSRRPLALPLIWIVVVAAVAMIAVVAAAAGAPRTLNAGSNGTPNGVLAAAASPGASGAAASPNPSGAPGKAGDEVWKVGGGPGLGIGGRGTGPGRITITAINGAQLSLRTDNGWTRTIDASNAEIYRGETEIALSDLQVGDQIVFRGVRGIDGASTITRIQVLDPSVAGTITGITDSIGHGRAAGRHEPHDPDHAATTYTLGRETVSRDQALVAGNQLHAVGTRSGDTFTATAIHVAPATLGGEVTAKTASTITIADAAGATRTINVTTSTTYRIAGDDTPSLDDIAVGDRIAAQGTLRSDGSLDATIVAEGRFGKGPGPGGSGQGRLRSSRRRPSRRPRPTRGRQPGIACSVGRRRAAAPPRARTSPFPLRHDTASSSLEGAVSTFPPGAEPRIAPWLCGTTERERSNRGDRTPEGAGRLGCLPELRMVRKAGA